MNVKWIGQAGLLIDTGRFKIIADPYLSDSVSKINPKNFRRVPADEKLFDEEPDLILITHEHMDHLDPETLPRFLNTERNITVLAPRGAWEKLRLYGGGHNYVMFNRGTVFTYKGVAFTAVKAEHSDINAIGCVINVGGKKLYITGDTLYNKEIFHDLPEDIYAVFLPINGVGNNMNIVDAENFAKKCGAKFAVPVHWGMFDNIDPADFDTDGTVIPEIYKEIKFQDAESERRRK